MLDESAKKRDLRSPSVEALKKFIASNYLYIQVNCSILHNTTMSDLIRTIESDDEDIQLSVQAAPSTSSTAPTAAELKKRKREGGNSSNKKLKGKAAIKSNDVKGKGKGRQVEENEDVLDGEFQFDTLGGGGYLSRGARVGDSWVGTLFTLQMIDCTNDSCIRTSMTCLACSRNAMLL
jgi:hypothetical protein